MEVEETADHTTTGINHSFEVGLHVLLFVGLSTNSYYIHVNLRPHTTSEEPVKLWSHFNEIIRNHQSHRSRLGVWFVAANLLGSHPIHDASPECPNNAPTRRRHL
jgi:hypothetical protein